MKLRKLHIIICELCGEALDIIELGRNCGEEGWICKNGHFCDGPEEEYND